MRDPHVEAVYYEIGTASDNISYDNPPPMAFGNDIGKFNLADCKLTVELLDHFPDEQSARQLVDTFLRSWETQTDLTAHLGQIRFKFQKSKIIDRDPPARGEAHVAHVTVRSMITVGEKATVSLKCNKYPGPPDAFATTGDVDLAHARWVRFREGKEPLQSMAYFVLTLIERLSGSRKKAAQVFQIDLDVLRKIGELSSTKGDANTARKAKFVDMTGAENGWLEAGIRRVIVRIGEHASGSPLTKITLADLPKLS